MILRSYKDFKNGFREFRMTSKVIRTKMGCPEYFVQPQADRPVYRSFLRQFIP